ncbi:copper homeostasis protein CutC [Nocardioides perillae]|uniref:Copper homeostasis protein cutC homolog n=1 Tax=Nocardioides perillae TaxID=1119534 RepID=A0A7Y9RU04_9ACTN|nr:copper homeostasis protein [Nocardioides perillae]
MQAAEDRVEGRAALLEVAVDHPRDVPGAVEGGADRLLLADRTRDRTTGLAPEPATVAAVCRDAAVPVHVVLRLSDGWSTTGGELARLVGLARDYLERGAAGLAFGFLDTDLEVAADVCAHLAAALPGVPWTFHEAFDAALDPRRSWRRVRDLPGLAGVRSAGSPRGLAVGYDDLLALVEADPDLAALLVTGAGLAGEHVPWLLRAGVTAYAVGPQVRPGGSPRAYVDAGLVRSWRLLLDRAPGRATGRAPA